MRTHFRDSKEWKDCGLEITGTSDEVCKLYDAALSSMISWGYESHYGTTDEIMQKIQKAAPESVLPRAFLVGVDVLSGKTVYDHKETKESVENLLNSAKKLDKQLTEREKFHVAAIDFYSQGECDKAILEWENVLIDNPTDIQALLLIFFALFHSGEAKQLMNVINGVADYYDKSVPLHEYVSGLHAFALEEAGQYEKAKNVALEGIRYAPYDAFSYHSLAHVYEMTRKLDEGRKFIEDSRTYWETGTHLACHNTWHNALFYFENCDFEAALEVYDSRLKKYLVPDNFLAYSDVASLFYRFKMAGHDVGKERWRELNAVTDHYIGALDRPFSSSHILIGVLGDQNSQKKQQILNSAKEMTKINAGYKAKLHEDIGLNLLNGICKFDEGEYDEAVDYLKPIRRNIYKIGGSHAQRDVYDQLLCNAALNSKLEHNQNFARILLAERQATFPGPLTDKMASRLLASHHTDE